MSNPPTYLMLCPPLASASQVIGLPSGTVYTPDQYGYITAALADLPMLLAAGYVVKAYRDNLAATSDPGVANDNTQDYGVGSRWLNTATGLMWVAQSVATGAAVWVPQGSNMIGRLIGANMNITTDQPIPLFVPTPFRITKITAKNASVSLTTAAGGIYTAASKGGTPVVASGQVYTALTTSALAVDLTIATIPGETVYPASEALFLSLTTPQGAAATADLYLFGDRYA